MPSTVRTRIIESPVDELKRFREKMPGSRDTRAIAELAGVGKGLIVARTSSGVGAGNRPFTPYSTKPYYAPIERRPAGYPKPSGGRSESLRGGKAMKSVFYAGGYKDYHSGIGRGSRVTLGVSGGMLNAISIATAGPMVAYLFFADRKEAAKAHGHTFGTVVPRRPFFDLSDFNSETMLKLELLRLLRKAAKAARLELKARG